MVWMPMPDQSAALSAAMFLLMWLSMMVAMMLPSALPMLLRFHRSARAGEVERPGIATAMAAAGYFSVWTGIGLTVYAVGAVCARMSMGSSAVDRAAPALLGGTLALAGTLQFGPWTLRQLAGCKTPFVCSPAVSSPGWRLGLSHGLRQGVSCAICCSGPMLALLAVGIMNPYAMSAVAALIALEKLLRNPGAVVRVSGGLAVLAGIVAVIRTF
jgi:predicted metal-binding membrane protein